MRLYSDRESVERGEITVLAIVETIAMVTLSAWIAIRYGTVKHIAIGACVAPLLLLRTERSTQLGLIFLNRAERLCSRIDDTRQRTASDNEWQAQYRYYKMGQLINYVTIGAPIVIRILATLVGTLLAPIQAFRSIPLNWKRVTLCSDSLLIPEPVPGFSRFVPFASPEVSLSEAYAFPGVLRFIKGHPLWLLPLVVFSAFVQAALVFLPVIAYRWSLKSTSLIYLPLLWAVSSTFKDDDNIRGRLLFTGRSAFARLLAIYSLIVLGLLITKGILYGTWDRFKDAAWWRETKVRQIIAGYVEPDGIPIWQIASGTNALLGLGLFLFAWYTLQRQDAKLAVNESAADRVMKSTVFIRSLLTIYILACTIYITVNAARGWPWPKLGTKVFPWG